jgi:hypothetical protein
MKIRILDEAISDLRLGAQFYEDQSAGLGTYFLDTLFSDIESLHLYAGVHIQVEGYYRSLSKRFPFAIYYKFEGEIILIYAVLDCRRKPSTNIDFLTSRRT